MKDEPMLKDECSSCLLHEATLKDKDSQITQLKQAILLSYANGEEDDGGDVEQRWLEVVSKEFSDLNGEKRKLRAELEEQTRQTKTFAQI
jgi:hypothetical protein